MLVSAWAAALATAMKGMYALCRTVWCLAKDLGWDVVDVILKSVVRK